LDGIVRTRRIAITWALIIAWVPPGVVLTGYLPGSSAQAAGLTVGFSADSVLTQGNSATRAYWLSRAVSDGASMVRVNIRWPTVAPTHRPSGFVPTNPASKGYDWGATDAAIRDAAAHGLTILVTLYGTPAWAEGPNRPAKAYPGTWRPSPSQFGDFATATARRYSGSYPDPKNPLVNLPRVRLWQAWNEPNLWYDLSPQWTQVGNRYLPAAPEIYRGLLNSFYRAVKAVSKSNTVLASGTAPYGDPAGTAPILIARMEPVQFYRCLFCLNRSLKRVGCPGPVYLDAVDHHPYEHAAPTKPAALADNVAVPDVWKITKTVRAGVRAGTVLPRGNKPVWVTELDWDTNPPDKTWVAFPLKAQARFVSQAMYVLWRQRVSVVLWLQIRDEPPDPQWLGEFRWGGMYFYSGAPKPSAVAFRFPFAARRLDRRHIQVWTRVPRAGMLKVAEQGRSGRWKVIFRHRVGVHQVLAARLPVSGRSTLRASVGASTSLPWSQGG
jgi:hypothetical protein